MIGPNQRTAFGSKEASAPGLISIDEHHASDAGDKLNPNGLSPPPIILK